MQTRIAERIAELYYQALKTYMLSLYATVFFPIFFRLYIQAHHIEAPMIEFLTYPIPFTIFISTWLYQVLEPYIDWEKAKW